MSMEQKVKDDRVMLVKIREVYEDKRRYRADLVVREAEVAIKVGGKSYIRLFCLPSHFEELAIGYFKSEGFDPSHISNIEVKQVNPEKHEINMDIETEKKVHQKKTPPKVKSELKIRKEEVFYLAKQLEEVGILYKDTGGTHVAASLNQEREIIFIEDVSRHCAIDKLIGLCIKNGIELSESVLVTSCRHTHSTMKKAISAGFPIIISVSAPTHLAVKSAEEFGVTLIGFARDKRFNVYTNEWRIL